MDNPRNSLLGGFEPFGTGCDGEVHSEIQEYFFPCSCECTYKAVHAIAIATDINELRCKLAKYTSLQLEQVSDAASGSKRMGPSEFEESGARGLQYELTRLKAARAEFAAIKAEGVKTIDHDAWLDVVDRVTACYDPAEESKGGKAPQFVVLCPCNVRSGPHPESDIKLDFWGRFKDFVKRKRA